MGWVVIRVFAIHAENVLEIFPRIRCLPEYILFLSHCSHEKNWRTLARSDGLWIAAEAATSGVWTAG